MSDFSDVIEIIHNIKDRELLADFLMALTTEKERAELSQRVQIVRRLVKGIPQLQISKDLGVGVATVTRGAKELASGKFKVLRRQQYD